MARGENPGVVLTIATTLTYDATKDYGHANAGKDLALSLVTSGANSGKAQLGADNARILGKFLSLDKDGVATYLATGTPMIFRRTSAAIGLSGSIVCGGSGKVKITPASGDGSLSGRGYVLEVESGDNGRVKVLMPA